MAEYTTILETTAHWAAIVTALIALVAYFQYLIRERSKRLKLEKYLKKEKQDNNDRGQRSLVHLTAEVGLTEAELLQASFISKKISRRVTIDKQTGLANLILLEHID